MAGCKYCAQSNTRLDELGYCKKYNCLERSGKKPVLDNLIDRAHKIYTLPKYKQLEIRSYVSNGYSPRDREANDILYECNEEFGFVPLSLLNAIPNEHMKKWDRDIRW